jgi:hypothetical protein
MASPKHTQTKRLSNLPERSKRLSESIAYLKAAAVTVDGDSPSRKKRFSAMRKDEVVMLFSNDDTPPGQRPRSLSAPFMKVHAPKPEAEKAAKKLKKRGEGGNV